MKPNFYILGAPKCGTTTLAEWLNEHPNVFMSPVKEPHYYSYDLKNRQARTEQEYLRLFKKVTKEHKAIGEASVWYLYSQVAVVNVLKETPEAKFIVCLRNPIDMAYSLHGQQIVSANENINNFKEAWDAQEFRKKGLRVPKFCEDPSLLLYGETCLLGQQLSRLYEIVDKKNVKIILLEDMKNNPHECYQSLVSFLKLPKHEITYKVSNVASQRRWPKLHKAVKAINYGRRKIGIPRIGTGIMPLLNKWNRTNSNRPKLDEDTREMLVNYFKNDIKLIEKHLDRDLKHWL